MAAAAETVRSPEEIPVMLYKTLLTLHGLFGLVALATFWIAAFAKKGSPLHVRTGNVYLASMLGIVVTAVPMSAIIAFSGRPGVATFLAYLVVITASAMWLGRRAVRRKRDQAGFRDRAYLAVAVLNLIAAVAVFAVGVRLSAALLMGFSLIGLVTGVQMLIRRARHHDSPRWWLREHFGAMIGCGVATHVAFLAIGLDRTIRAVGIDPPGWYHLIAWFLPLLISLFIGVWLNRKYMSTKPSTVTQAG
jgi:hypothetical protein